MIFPFRLTNTIFSRLTFTRQPEVPGNLQLKINANVQMHLANLPDGMQVDIRLETLDEQPLTFAIELIALFETIDNESEGDEIDPQLAKDFVNQRAFYMLFPLVRQKISEITYIMGVKPVNLPMPVSVEIPLDEDDPEKMGTAQF